MYDLSQDRHVASNLSKAAFDRLKKSTQLTNYAGKGELVFGIFPVVFVGDCVFVDDNGLLKYLGAIYYGSTMPASQPVCTVYGCENVDYGANAALLRKGKRKKENKAAPFLIVNNADNPTGDYTPVEFHPTLSFQCVAQLLEINGDEDSQDNEVATLFVNATLRIIDYTFDHRIPLTKKEKTLLKQRALGSKVKPPKPPRGYSLVGQGGQVWHRSSSVVFCDTRTEKFYLCGQDEDSYYGVELPKNVKTIAQAFNSLRPKDAQAKGTQRQGEWFIVPVKEPLVKLHTIPVVDNGLVVLPKDDPLSNDHIVEAKTIIILPEQFPRSGVYAEGQKYVGSLSHDEHEEVKFTGWVTFVHNLARKSVSTEGVD